MFCARVVVGEAARCYALVSVDTNRKWNYLHVWNFTKGAVRSSRATFTTLSNEQGPETGQATIWIAFFLFDSSKPASS